MIIFFFVCEIGCSGLYVFLFFFGLWYIYDCMDFVDVVVFFCEVIDCGVNFFDVGVYFVFDVLFVFIDVIFLVMVCVVGFCCEEWLLLLKLWFEVFGGDGFCLQFQNVLMWVGIEYVDFVIFGDLCCDDFELCDFVFDFVVFIDVGFICVWGVNNWLVGSIQVLIDFVVVEGVFGLQIVQFKYSVLWWLILDGELFVCFWEQGFMLQVLDCLEGGIFVGKVNGDWQIGCDFGGICEWIIVDVFVFMVVVEDFDVMLVQFGIVFIFIYFVLMMILFGVFSVVQLWVNFDVVVLVDCVGVVGLCCFVEFFWVDCGVVDFEGF